MADKAAGNRLAKVLRVAMAQAGIETWTMLGLESGVSPTTIDNWIYGTTTPRAFHLSKVAKRLHPYVSGGDLERAYQGLAPEEPPLIEVLARDGTRPPRTRGAASRSSRSRRSRSRSNCSGGTSSTARRRSAAR